MIRATADARYAHNERAESTSRTSGFARLRAALIRPPLWLTLLVCAAILVARRPSQIRNPQFWAEDGTVFYAQAYTSGAAVLTRSFAGFLHTTTRLGSAVAQWFDPALAPAVFTTIAFLLTLYVALRTQSSRFPLPPHVGYALAVVLVPDMFEILLFLVSVDRILAAALLLLLISKDARRWWQHAHDIGAAVLLGLTGPYSTFFAPLFVWRALRRRTRASVAVAAVVFLCGAIQGTLIVRHQLGTLSDGGFAAMGAGEVREDKILAVPGMRIAGSLLVGSRVPEDYPLPVETALGIFTLAAVGWLGLRKGAARLERAWLAIAFVLALGSAIYRCRFVLPDLCHQAYGARYFYLPQIVAVWLLIAFAAERRGWVSRGAAAILVWMLAVNVPRLREGELQDFEWTRHAAQIRAGEAVEIPINPGGVEPWVVRLPARKS